MRIGTRFAALLTAIILGCALSLAGLRTRNRTTVRAERGLFGAVNQARRTQGFLSCVG